MTIEDSGVVYGRHYAYVPVHLTDLMDGRIRDGWVVVGLVSTPVDVEHAGVYALFVDPKASKAG